VDGKTDRTLTGADGKGGGEELQEDRSQERLSKEIVPPEGPISIMLWMGEQAKH
jgi:hypothetical protein